MGNVPSEGELPQPETYKGEYGDAYAVGTNPPYTLHIWTRPVGGDLLPGWFNIGEFPAPSQRPGWPTVVEVGTVEVDKDADVSVEFSTYTDELDEYPNTRGKATFNFKYPRAARWYAKEWGTQPDMEDDMRVLDMALDTTTGDVYQYVSAEEGWVYIGNIKGIQGIQGEPFTWADMTDEMKEEIRGPEGRVGPIGPVGPQGQFIEVVGELDSIDQLPDPKTVPRYSAYIINIDGDNHIYLISGEEELEWVDAGKFGGGTRVTASGVPIDNYDASYVNNTDEDNLKVDAISKSDDGISMRFINSFDNAAGVGMEKYVYVDLSVVNSDTIDVLIKGTQLMFELNDGAKKLLDAAVAKSSTGSILYGTDASGNQTLLKYASGTTGNSIVQRQSNGCITVPSAPQANTDAVSKKYVDDTEDALQGQIDQLAETVDENYYNIHRAMDIVYAPQMLSSGDNTTLEFGKNGDSTINFHTNDYSNAYDAYIKASNAQNASASGTAQLSYVARAHAFSGNVNVTGNISSTGSLNADVLNGKTWGNAILRQAPGSSGNVIIGSFGRKTYIVGNSDRPYYTKTDSDINNPSGVMQLATMDDVSSAGSNWTKGGNINGKIKVSYDAIGQTGPEQYCIQSLGTGESKNNGTWQGRILAGGKNNTFLLGEYNGLAGMGAHNAELNSWAGFYIQPDGDHQVYIGADGTGWTQGSGTLIVKGNPSTKGGGTITANGDIIANKQVKFPNDVPTDNATNWVYVCPGNNAANGFAASNNFMKKSSFVLNGTTLTITA